MIEVGPDLLVTKYVADLGDEPWQLPSELWPCRAGLGDILTPQAALNSSWACGSGLLGGLLRRPVAPFRHELIEFRLVLCLAQACQEVPEFALLILHRSTGRIGRGPSVLRHARHRPSLQQSLAGAK